MDNGDVLKVSLSSSTRKVSGTCIWRSEQWWGGNVLSLKLVVDNGFCMLSCHVNIFFSWISWMDVLEFYPMFIPFWWNPETTAAFYPKQGGFFITHDGSMVLLYMVTWIPSIYTRNTPFMLAYIWVNYNDLTTTSLGIIVSKGNHPLLWPNNSG